MHLSLILSAVILTNAIDVANAIIQHSYQSQFQLSGTVATVLSKHVLPCILIKDTTGSIPVAQLPAVSIASIPSPGDIVKIEGKIIQAQTGNAAAIFDQLDIIGHSTPPRSITTTIRDVKSGHHDWNLVTVRGRVHECFIDDIDPNWRILILNDNGNFIYTAYHTSSCVDIGADTLFDAEIDFTGICFPRTKSWRQQIGRTLTSYGENPIHIVTPSPPDKFNAPRLNISTADSPESIHSYGHRVIEGEVIACWEKSFILLKDISSDTHVVKFPTTSRIADRLSKQSESLTPTFITSTCQTPHGSRLQNQKAQRNAHHFTMQNALSPRLSGLTFPNMRKLSA